MTFKDFLKGGWFRESHRAEHYTYGIMVGLLLTLFGAIGCALGLEYKDKAWGGRWDWLDLLATVFGGVLGQLLQAGIVVFLVNVK